MAVTETLDTAVIALIRRRGPLSRGEIRTELDVSDHRARESLQRLRIAGVLEHSGQPGRFVWGIAGSRVRADEGRMVQRRVSAAGAEPVRVTAARSVFELAMA